MVTAEEFPGAFKVPGTSMIVSRHLPSRLPAALKPRAAGV